MISGVGMVSDFNTVVSKWKWIQVAMRVQIVFMLQGSGYHYDHITLVGFQEKHAIDVHASLFNDPL